uniref:glycosyltransferase n=2 Tax=Gelidibacter sp. TaxID=2018083 RepID=UPI00404B20A0
MEALHFSFIIPVFNRPDEVHELLESFTKLHGSYNYEIVIIEDGSTLSSKTIADSFSKQLNISYFFKVNSGPGDSRNFGMRQAKGNYFIILDSDCLLPPNYLNEVNDVLSIQYVDCFGGPDAAHESFTNLQKAINFTMTSFMTTGGIRGGKQMGKNFQPRSFNMGISKKAFEVSGGFGSIHPGEDPDLSIRLSKLGYVTLLISKAFVYHKRRISWKKFYQQVHKFGLVRPIINLWHPETERLVYWFPTLFLLGFIMALILLMFGIQFPILLYLAYFIIAFFMTLTQSKNIIVAIQSMMAICIQFFGYGYGFLKSTFYIKILKRQPEKQFPKLFFKK